MHERITFFLRDFARISEIPLFVKIFKILNCQRFLHKAPSPGRTFRMGSENVAMSRMLSRNEEHIQSPDIRTRDSTCCAI